MSSNIKRVLLVGSNPSVRSPDTSAFHPHTRSRKIIDKWFRDIPVDLHFTNIHNHPTPNNRPLRASEINQNKSRILEECSDFDYVIGLGNTASDALKKIRVSHFKCPHPSGMNRVLNNAKYVDDLVDRLKNFLLH